jgi:membrane protein implicated in regulation of membrane protease activity
MARLNRHTLLGGFCLMTLILAGAAVRRLAGLGMWEALYVSALAAALLVTAAYRLSRCAETD